MPTTRPILRYPGGKYRARTILTNALPQNPQNLTILSPFFGGGSFELHIAGQGARVIGADYFYVLSVFWEELISNPEQLADAITPFLGTIDSPTFKVMQTQLKEENAREHTDNPLTTAAHFFIVNRCSFSGATLSGGFSREASVTRFTQSIVDRVRAFASPQLSMSYADAHELLSHVPETVNFLFLDPPYLLEKEKNSLYGDNGNLHRGFDHARLRAQVEETGLPFLLTYNNDPEIHKLWDGYSIEEASWAYGMNKSKKSSEVLIKNY